MVIGIMIVGTIFVQVVLLLIENYLLGYEGEPLLLFKLRIVFQWWVI